MIRRSVTILLLLAVAYLGFALNCEALINPNFTPVHLVKQAGTISRIQFKLPIKDNKIEATATFLKGREKSNILKFDLSTGQKAWIPFVVKIINAEGHLPAIFFGGRPLDQPAKDENDGEEVQAGFVDVEVEAVKGYLHIAGYWIVFFQGDNGVWEMDTKSDPMQATWAGSTDMLLLCVDYIQKDPDADVPVATGAEWAGKEKAVDIAGTVQVAMAVEVTGDKPYLHLGSDKGDKLLAHTKGKKMIDVTAKHKLAANSLVATWADLNGDKKIDLVSWDGKELSLHYQGADSTFTKVPLKNTDATKEGCLSLTPVDSGKAGAPAIVIATTGSPVWLVAGDGKNPVVKKLSETGADTKDLGKAGKCLIADFDNDSLPDVLHMWEKGSLFYKCTALGQYAAPTKTAAALGPGRNDACVGDYDMDGTMDIFCVATDACRLWHNLSNLKFEDKIHLAGEVAYISKPGGIKTATVEINNDGRQDIFIVYSGMAPHLFFNRGFRSFGHSHKLDLDEHKFLEGSEKGTQACAFGDFNNDGGQDMAVVMLSGEVWVFFRDVESSSGLAANISIPPGDSYSGPLNVKGWSNDRCLGSWNVVPGIAPAFFGQFDAGPLVIKWKLPGGKMQKKEILLEEGAKRFMIETK